jgi:hypothetical protein
MSLPPTQKDISANPAKGSVVEPTNIQKKDKDVERKVFIFPPYYSSAFLILF